MIEILIISRTKKLNGAYFLLDYKNIYYDALVYTNLNKTLNKLKIKSDMI